MNHGPIACILPKAAGPAAAPTFKPVTVRISDRTAGMAVSPAANP